MSARGEAEDSKLTIPAVCQRVSSVDDDVIERLDAMYCVDCDVRMLPGTRHPHELIPVLVTVTRRRA